MVLLDRTGSQRGRGFAVTFVFKLVCFIPDRPHQSARDEMHRRKVLVYNACSNRDSECI